MIHSNALNLFFGSALIIILILDECLIKYKNDKKIKKIFCIVLITVLLALTADFLTSFYFTDIFNTPIHAKLIWPFISALLLFIYLFLIIKENKIDSLTGLDNRYSFFELTGRISRSRSGESWIFAMVDINNFRSINEIYGNLEGDTALRSFAQIVKKCSRKTDFAARYGGDEFVLVNKTENGLVELIEKVTQELNNYNDNNNKSYNIEISYGIDTYVSDGSKSIDDFLNHIDKFMHKHSDASRRAGDFKA